MMGLYTLPIEVFHQKVSDDLKDKFINTIRESGYNSGDLMLVNQE